MAVERNPQPFFRRIIMNAIQLNGSWLKVIAILSMLIDHLAYYYGCTTPYFYELMRTVGRIAFPVFAFLLAEGFAHTHNERRYMTSLFAFALISEVPWFLLNHDTTHNVLFTLLAGLLGMHILSTCKQKWTAFAFLMTIAIITALTETDYSWYGFGLCMIFFMFRGQPLLQAIFGIPLMYDYGFPGILLAFMVITLYNGERGFIHGRCAKYLCYAFYPCHLMLIYLAKVIA